MRLTDIAMRTRYDQVLGVVAATDSNRDEVINMVARSQPRVAEKAAIALFFPLALNIFECVPADS
jgi:hypothetical protein